MTFWAKLSIFLALEGFFAFGVWRVADWHFASIIASQEAKSIDALKTAQAANLKFNQAYRNANAKDKPCPMSATDGKLLK